MQWFAEFRIQSDSELNTRWERINDRSYKTQEQAKSLCKRFLEETDTSPHRLHFRIVRSDDRHTIEQVSNPPHGWRLRWKWA